MSNFTFTETKIKGVCIIDVKTYGDNRGYFMETYKEEDFKGAGLDYNFVQDNQSSSRKGVLRGLHFQKTYPQAKLVRVLKGEVFDVAVDLRKGSETYGQWVGVILSEENHRQFMIPAVLLTALWLFLITQSLRISVTRNIIQKMKVEFSGMIQR